MLIAATYVSKSVHFFRKRSTPLPPPNNFWIGSTLCLIWQTGIDLRCRCLILSDVCTVLPSWLVSLLWIRATETLVIASQSTRVHTNLRHTLRTELIYFCEMQNSKNRISLKSIKSVDCEEFLREKRNALQPWH